MSRPPRRGPASMRFLRTWTTCSIPLMEKARAKRADSSAPSSDQSGGPPPIESDVSPEDQVKLDGFLATCLQPPPLAVMAQPLTGGIGADGKRPPPRRGFGPPVFVGFDCEWEYQAKGRNVLLSVQFYVVGPTGLRYSKVINLVGKDAVQDRPSLAEALYDLLDEAEIECVFDEWPEEVVLCGHFTRPRRADAVWLCQGRFYRGQWRQGRLLRGRRRWHAVPR